MTRRPSAEVALDTDLRWPVIEAERRRAADLLADLTGPDWDQPSLCAGWAVRDVAAHLTLQQLGARAAAGMMLAYRGDTERAIGDRARQRARDWPAAKIIAEIRRTAGSRRHNFGVTSQETLIDILVHAQDMAIPLGRAHPVPPEAAAAAATRIWTMRWPPPFPARRVLQHFRVTATDLAWSAGDGPPVSAPIGSILLLLAGRLAALPDFGGDGAARLAAAFASQAAEAAR